MDTVHPRLPVTREQLTELCQRWKIRELALFGSVTREDFRPDSDIDVMVEFEPGGGPGLKVLDVLEELQRLLGRNVDLMVKGPIRNPYKRRSIEKDLTVIYAA